MSFTCILRGIGSACVVLVLALFAGCAATMGQPQASIEDVQAIRGAQLPPVAVGDFSLASGVDPAIDTSVGIRATSLKSPIDGSFTQYLRQTLIAELRAAGLLEQTSPTMIQGVLADRQVDAGMGTGSGKLTARFTVKKRGTSVYDREFTATSTWDSSFIGAVAIPAAINEFTLLFRKLVAMLLADPEFRKAMLS